MPVNIDYDSRIYKLFVSSLRSKHTRKAYETALVDFMEYAGISTLDELTGLDRDKFQDKLIDFVIDKRKTLSYNSVSTKLAGMMKFCTMLDREINWKKVYSFLGEYTKTIKDRVYTREELQKVIQNADIRARVLVLLLTSTGMRIGAVPDLCIRHLKKWESYGFYQFTIYEKAREEYVCFCTPECAKEIDAYLAYRRRFGETITSDSPLIRDDFPPEDDKSASCPRRVTHAALRSNFGRLLIKTGVRTKSTTRKRQEVMIMHSMRKYCNTHLIKAGVNGIIKEMLIGHSVKLDDAYFRPTDEELLKEYVKAIPLLSISNETRLNQQVTKLEEDLTQLKSVELEMSLKDRRISELSQQLKTIEAKNGKEIAELKGIVLALKAHIDNELTPMVSSKVEEAVSNFEVSS